MADQQFCLRWNNHQSTLISVFDTLLENGTLVDCTLAAEGQYLKAHKVVLSACSPYLEALLSQHYEKHPIVILKDVKFSELKSMMDYMYRGEVNISQDQLGTFLKAAESLQIKGLSDNGADGDARDVGSTPKTAPPPQRKSTQPAPPARPVVEPQRPDVAPESPVHRSRDGSISPSSRKRRRIRRNSQGDDSNLGDSHLDTSNSCDLPSQAQSTPIVPNIPATVTSSITTTPIIKTPIVKPEQTELVNRIDSSNLNSLPPESGLLKEKMEPLNEPLIEPKTEYLDDMNTNDSVEDLTLDDDDDMDGMDISNMSNMSNMSRPGPSHGNDISNQGFAPWHLGGNQSGTDEVFMAAQEAVGAHRDSQGPVEKNGENKKTTTTLDHDYIVYFLCSGCKKLFYTIESYQNHPCAQKDNSMTLTESSTKNNSLTNEDTPNFSNDLPSEQDPVPIIHNTPISIQDPSIPRNISPSMKQDPLLLEKTPTNPLLKCPNCKKLFRSKYYLTHHSCVPPASNPLPSGALGTPPFLCPGCGIIYKHKGSYCRHIHHECGKTRRTYLGKSPYTCKTCGKMYKHKSTFSRHVLHECNQPPKFQCALCQKRFTTNYSMKKHKHKNHHQPCPLCNMQFINKFELDTHVQNDHISFPDFVG